MPPRLHPHAMTRIAIAARQVAGLTGLTGIVLEHARRLAALGWEVHVFAERLEPERIRATGSEPHRVAVWPLGRQLKRRFFARAASRAARAARSDLVWGHGDLLDQDVLSLHNCVHAAHEAVHGRPLPARSGVGALHARVLRERRFRRLIANSELMKRELTGRFGVPEEAVTVVHPGYDPARFRPEERAALGPETRRRLGVTDEEVLVGLVTSGDFAKRGVDRLLAALALLSPQARRRVRAVVVGHDSRWRPAGGRERAQGVRFLPPVRDVERVYHALDLLVHPALLEEFGMSVLEAMACGVPVVTSARVGAAELLRAAAPRAVLESPRPEAIAHHLEALALDPERRRRLGAQCREACRGHTWDESCAATRRCLEAALEDAGRPVAARA